MSKSIVQEKADAFAVRIVKAYKYITNQKHEYIMSKQLYRSGTSIQANIAEAQYAQSRKDFINKMSIALKEANESRRWIGLLHKTSYLSDREYTSIYHDVNEIVMILISIIRKSKKNENKNNKDEESSSEMGGIEQ